MTPSPVQAVARAARHRMLRNTLIAAAIVVTTATGVTAGLVWPVGHATRVSCPASRTLVSVRPFALPLGVAEDLAPTPAADRPGEVEVPVIAGCVDRADLTPANTDRTDERG